VLVNEGATHSAISGKIVRQLETLGIKRSPTTLKMSDVQGNPLDVRSSMLIPVTIKGQVRTWPLYIVKKFDGGLILGADFMVANKMSQDFENKTIDFKKKQDRYRPVSRLL
jgi:hypothetical protein